MEQLHTWHIGILEDDIPQANMVMDWLTQEGYKVTHCREGKPFIKLLQDETVDVGLVDWVLPDFDGLQVLKKIRNGIGYTGPILFITKRDSEEDLITALDAGADDYLVKPLRRGELLARVKALGRRSGINLALKDEIRVGPIKINLATKAVHVNGDLVKLTPKDYKLACCVLRNAGKLLTREFLLKEVWAVDSVMDTRTVDVHMSRIRRSLKIGPETGYFIRTVHRHGYRLEKLSGGPV